MVVCGKSEHIDEQERPIDNWDDTRSHHPSLRKAVAATQRGLVQARLLMTRWHGGKQAYVKRVPAVFETVWSCSCE